MPMRFACFALTCVSLAAGPPRPEIHGGTPAVSPDGSRIAYMSDRGGITALFVIAADGAGETELIGSPALQGFPRWAADGKRVMYFMKSGNGVELYAIDADGGSQERIGVVRGRAPVLSPDGRRVTYAVGPYATSRLWIADLNGAGARPLSAGTSPVWIGWWSPDGNSVAFAQRGPEGAQQVWISGLDGSGLRQFPRIDPAEGSAEWPAWSPDGRRLAVQVTKPVAGSAQIWIASLPSGEAKPIAPHQESYLDETPSWFPDGKRIALQSNRTGRMEIWVMHDDGSQPRQITR